MIVGGRGKWCQKHFGNLFFQSLVKAALSDYSQAKTKTDKSAILSRVVKQVQEKSSNAVGFVRQDPKTRQWSVVEGSAARIAAAQAFRDALHSNYRSSKHFKQMKRRAAAPNMMNRSHGSSNSLGNGIPTTIVLPRRVSENSLLMDDEESVAASSSKTAALSESDCFRLLAAKFAPAVVSYTEDPFSPCPIAESNVSILVLKKPAAASQASLLASSTSSSLSLSLINTATASTKNHEQVMCRVVSADGMPNIQQRSVAALPVNFFAV